MTGALPLNSLTDGGAKRTTSTTGRESDQFNIRLPPGVREEIAAAAHASGRSMNAELVQRVTGKVTPAESSAHYDGANAPTRQRPGYPLRLPEALDAEIRAAAEWTGRSVNGEITHRLKASGSPRDGFAGQALQGLCANPGGPFQSNSNSGWGIVNCTPDEVAEMAYRLADAMLRARALSPSQEK